MDSVEFIEKTLAHMERTGRQKIGKTDTKKKNGTRKWKIDTDLSLTENVVKFIIEFRKTAILPSDDFVEGDSKPGNVRMEKSRRGKFI